jgi:hypothetical protein
MHCMNAAVDRWAEGPDSPTVTGVLVSAKVESGVNNAFCTDDSGDTWILVRVPASVASVLKPVVAARDAGDSDPYASHLADAGMTAALRAWGAS